MYVHAHACMMQEWFRVYAQLRACILPYAHPFPTFMHRRIKLWKSRHTYAHAWVCTPPTCTHTLTQTQYTYAYTRVRRRVSQLHIAYSSLTVSRYIYASAHNFFAEQGWASHSFAWYACDCVYATPTLPCISALRMEMARVMPKPPSRMKHVSRTLALVASKYFAGAGVVTGAACLTCARIRIISMFDVVTSMRKCLQVVEKTLEIGT